MSASEVSPADADFGLLRGLGYGLGGIAFGLPLLLIIVKPGPASDVATVLAIGASALLFVVIAAAPRVFEVDSRRYNGRYVNFILVMPLIALWAPSIHAALVYPQLLLLSVGAFGALAIVIGLWLPARGVANPQFLVMFLGLYGAAFGWTAPLLADVRLDRAPGHPFVAGVVARHVSWGKGGTTYSLRLAPWGPVKRVSTVVVTAIDYFALRAGDVACVTLHDGALAMPWYGAARC